MSDQTSPIDRAPSTEAEIRAARIGEPTPKTAVVETIVARARAGQDAGKHGR